MLKIIKKAEPLDKEVLPFDFLGSPDCNIDRTFVSTFYFQIAVEKPSSPKKIYRNPIYLAREYKKMIDTGEAKDQAELAKIKGISRARVTQILNLLKLDKSIIDNLEQIGDPLKVRMVTERMLRLYVNKSPQEQKDLLNILKTHYKL